MFTLDLLPPKEKEQINIKKAYSLAKNLIILLFLVVGIASVFLIGARYIIRGDLENITKQNNLIIQSYEGLNQDTRKYNNELKRLSKIQEENIEFSEILIKINELIPSQITLNGLSMNLSSEKEIAIHISGFAKNRNNLINLREILNSSAFVKDIELPISSLLKQKDISFDLTAVIEADQVYD